MSVSLIRTHFYRFLVKQYSYNPSLKRNFTIKYHMHKTSLSIQKNKFVSGDQVGYNQDLHK